MLAWWSSPRAQRQSSRAACGVDVTLLARLHLLSFVLLGSFGVAAPAAQSLFLGHYPATDLPRAWLGVTAGSLVVVALLRRWARSLPVARCFALAAGSSAVMLTLLLAAYQRGLAGAAFGLYIWRDLYIIVTLELFWTLVGVTAVAQRASRAYGWLCASGTLGGVVASLATARIGASWGTAGALWGALPLLLLCVLLGLRLPAPAGVAAPAPEDAATPDAAAGLAGATRPARLASPADLSTPPLGPAAASLLGPATKHRALTARVGRILVLVALSHISLTILDYQFNQAVQLAYPEAGPRLQVVSHVQAALKGLSFILQISFSWSLRALGLTGALMATPLAIAAALSAHALTAEMSALTVAKVMGKSTDYALFRAAKEMLYVPLSYPEKTVGKALVDILGSRAVKGATSLALIAMPALGLAEHIRALGLVATVAWTLLSWPLSWRWPTCGQQRRE